MKECYILLDLRYIFGYNLWDFLYYSIHPVDDTHYSSSSI